MKRHELENFMVLQTREGDKFILIDDRLFAIGDNATLYLDDYNNDLLFEFPFRTENDKNRLDIMRVYEKSTLIWERKESPKAPIKVGDIFTDKEDDYTCYILKANPKTDMYEILYSDGEITWHFEEDGETIRKNCRKIGHIDGSKA